jgi:hypothetical protein
MSHYAGLSAWQILKKLENGKDEQVRKLHDAKAAGRDVVVVYWGLQNCLQQGTYIQAVVKICALLRG